MYLKNKEDEILVSSANGLLKMQKPSFDDTNQNSLLLKNAKWTIKVIFILSSIYIYYKIL